MIRVRMWGPSSWPMKGIVAPSAGFTPKELAWILTHAPTETIVLSPGPAAVAA